MPFEFDACTETWRSPQLSADLWARAQGIGPVFHHYAPVVYKSMHSLLDDECNDTRRLLVYQARWLRNLMPQVVPHLRAAQPRDFGLTHSIVWYSPEYDGALIGTDQSFAVAIHPTEVL